MKKKSPDEVADDLRPHYDFDFKNMKPNRFATQKKVYKQQFVVLDEDLSNVFESSAAVNDALRSVVHAMRNRRKPSAKGSSKRRAS